MNWWKPPDAPIDDEHEAELEAVYRRAFAPRTAEQHFALLTANRTNPRSDTPALMRLAEAMAEADRLRIDVRKNGAVQMVDGFPAPRREALRLAKLRSANLKKLHQLKLTPLGRLGPMLQ